MTSSCSSRDYQRIEAAIQYLDDYFASQPSLAEVAESVGLSPFHFQRLFKKWAGVSPKRFLQYLTLESAKDSLRRSASVLEASMDVGLSSTGRLHDLFVTAESVTPGEYKSAGEGLRLTYGFHDTPFGTCLLGASDRGVCWLTFLVADQDREEQLEKFRTQWPKATIEEDHKHTACLVRSIFYCENEEPCSIHLHGTNFEIKVWQALLRIPEGEVVAYGDVARSIDHPSTRAVASAIGRNCVGYLIPCHRVIRRLGEFGDYRWGRNRKKAMLGWERARREQLSSNP